MTYMPGDRVRLEIDAATVRNLIANHSGRNGSFAGWDTSDASLTPDAAGGVNGFIYMRYGAASTAASYWLSEAFPVVPGQYVGAQYDSQAQSLVTAPIAGTPSMLTQFYFYDAAGVQIASGPGAWADTTVSPTWTAGVQIPACVVPASAVTARIKFRAAENGATRSVPVEGHYFYNRHVMIISGATAGAVTGVAWTDQPTWLNIAGTSVSIRFSRGGELDGVTDAIEAGLLTVAITDATVDPTQNLNVRPGRKIRVRACADSNPVGGSFKTVFTGTLRTIDVTYGREKGRGRPRITIAATDGVAVLRGVSSPYGYSSTELGAKVEKLMEGTVAVPFFYASPEANTVVSRDDNANLWDQLILARNSHANGKLYLDQNNELQAKTTVTTAPGLTFSGDAGAALSFTDIDLTFGSAALVNSLTVVRHNLNETDGEKTYGPYVNPLSVAAWGTVAASVDAVDGTPSVLATNYLRKFANPEVFPRSITFNALDAGALAASAAYVELYAVARIILTSANVDRAVYVVGIEHDITPKRWTVTLRFRPLDTQAVDGITTPAAGPETGPADVVGPSPGPLASRYRSGAQAVAHNTIVNVALNAAVAADQIEWTSPSFTAPRAGRYAIAAGIRFEHATGGSRQLSILVNGSQQIRTVVEPNTAAVDECITVAKIIKLAGGDTVTLAARQTSGSSINVTDTDRGTYLDLSYLGD